MSDQDDYPTAHEAERCLLSCLMRGGGGVRQAIVDRMEPMMFDRYEDLALTAFTIAEDGRPDPDSVRAEHANPDIVSEVLESRPSPQQYERFMREVQESYGKMELIGIASEWSSAAKNGHSFDEVATGLEEDVIELTRRAGGDDGSDSTKVIREVLSDIEEEQGQRVTGISTPFDDINRMTRGLQDGELVIPFGSTSMGKTAWALSVALHAAKHGHPVAVHTLEMSQKALYRRLLLMESGVNLRQTRIPEPEMEKVSKAGSKLYYFPIYVVDKPGLDYVSHRSSLRRLQYKHGIELAVVDYLQIMGAPPSENYSKKHHQVHEAAQGLKDTAKILDIPVVTPSQTTKRADSQAEPATLSDLREAGEEPADVCISLYRPEYYGITQWPSGGDCEGEGLAAIAKQRNGPTGETKLAFVDERARWYPLEEHHTAPRGDGAPSDEHPF